MAAKKSTPTIEMDSVSPQYASTLSTREDAAGRTVVDAALELAQKAKVLSGESLSYAGANLPLVLMAHGVSAFNIERFLPAPLRIVETVRVGSAESFVDYWKRFSVPGSLLRLNVEKRSAVGVLDYHQPDAPAWGEHAVEFKLEIGRRLAEWKEYLGKAMSQEVFSLFVEDHLRDVSSPPAAELLEAALSINVSRKMTFGSTIRLTGGERSYTFKDENDAPVTIPEKIILQVPLFERAGVPPVSVEIRVRYRIVEGKLTLHLRAPHLEQQIEDAASSVLDIIAEKVRQFNAKALVIFEP